LSTIQTLMEAVGAVECTEALEAPIAGTATMKAATANAASTEPKRLLPMRLRDSRIKFRSLLTKSTAPSSGEPCPDRAVANM